MSTTEARKKKSNTRLVFVIILFILGLPLWMWLAWLMSDRHRLVVAIIDKTVLNDKRQEHISLNWVLNHERYMKNNSQLYELKSDYFGFFPLKDEQYQVKGLERFDSSQIQMLKDTADVAYITDAYGIYRNEWYKVYDPKDRSPVVYGGMSDKDMDFLKGMQNAHKLIITEFNCIATPTSDSVRTRFDSAFGIKWSGWVGRYFDSFDTLDNKELPHWVYHNYMAQHNGAWPFKKSGICYVRIDDTIVILENEVALDKETPYMLTNEQGQSYYGLPAKIKYPYWFEIDASDSSRNTTIAHFETYPNAKGLDTLAKYGLPVSFPAITYHNQADYKFFYFCADFCDNPIKLATSYFNGIAFFDWLFYNQKDPIQRSGFFWLVYRPLVTRILNDYYAEIKKDGRK